MSSSGSSDVTSEVDSDSAFSHVSDEWQQHEQPQRTSSSSSRGRRVTVGGDADHQATRAHGSPHASKMPAAFLQSLNAKSPVWVLKWDHSGHTLLSGGSDGVVRLWQRVDQQQHSLSWSPVELNGHTAAVTDADWTTDGLAVSASMDRTVRVWSAKGALVATMEHPDIVTCVSCCPTNPRKILTGCLDNTVRQWDLSGNGTVTQTASSNLGEFVTALCWTDAGTEALTGTDNGHVALLRADTLKPSKVVSIGSFRGKRLRRDARKILGIATRGEQAWITCSDNRLRRLELPSLEMSAKFKGLRNAGSVTIRAALSSGREPLVACGSLDSEVLVWGATEAPIPSAPSFICWVGQSRAPAQRVGTELPCSAVAFFPGEEGEKFLVGADSTGRIMVLDCHGRPQRV